eukprot:CAMPEP_0172313258 /NCGR_PEP_ID=MMETSP1058-20130122/19855_1 /TAXON_ID=83371 /ORGANISM="Detonula confervacea, Strain CCMP 353" /LENGTH=330 /DNA_ID=CAMNT_0013026881 /DNA_START=71 /DNA_END=1063 /DNA_ORIENTATION=+
MRQAAAALLRRGNQYRRALPVSAAPGSLNSTSHYGGVQRLLASSSKSPTPVRPTTHVSSQTKDKGQEAIEKSQRLHAELSEMIEAQKARTAEELQRPWGSNFLSFLKGSKAEIVNIFFAFICVLLAYQIHGMRAGIKKLLAAQEEKDAEIGRLRGILANLSEGDIGALIGASEEEDTNNNSFSAKLAQKCAGVVRNIFEESEKRVGYSWILGKKLASGDALEVEKLVDELQPVILSNVQAFVGDAAFTPEELKERRVAALKVENELSAQSSILDDYQPNNGAGGKDAQMGDLMTILEEVHSQDLTDERNTTSDEDGNTTSTKVRRTRYAI